VKQMRRRGFSIIELLLVLAILAVVLALGYASLQPLMLRSRLNEAATAVATSLQRARSFAQRSNQPAQWRLISADSFRLDLGGTSHDTTLPSGLTIIHPAVGSQITYSPPYGEVSAIATQITISGYGYEVDVRVVGVTGKVIRSNVR